MPRSISRTALALALTLAVTGTAAPDAGTPPVAPDPKLLARARSILERAPLIDTHNDLPFALLLKTGGDLSKVDLARRQPELPADVPRLREGRVGAQYWSIFVPSGTSARRESMHEAVRVLDLALRLIESRPELELARTAEDIVRITRAGRIASLLGIEGGHMVESSPAAVRIFHRLGARYMTLTHGNNTEWADSATDRAQHQGLTRFGERLVAELNRTGMFVDLSHVTPDVMRDALRVSKAPVIFSHSDSLALVPHPRNVPDDVLQLLRKNGGVIHVSFIRQFVVPDPGAEARHREAVRTRRARAIDDGEADRQLAPWEEPDLGAPGSVASVADVLDHMRAVAGVDHLGIGADFFDDGKRSMVAGLEDVTRYPALFAELLRRGWAEEDLLKVAGRNHLRAMREMERVAAELQRTTAPYMVQGPRDP